jgi:HK97 family phage major capsid protein
MTYTVTPFLLAMLIGIAWQGLDIYLVNARNVGTLDVGPWRAKTASLARAVATAFGWLKRVLRRNPQLLAAAVLVAIALLTSDVHAGAGVVLAVVPPVGKDAGAWASEIIEAADSSGIQEADVERIRADAHAWMKVALAPVERIDAECRAEGRATLRADEQRTTDRAYKEIGKVQMAVANLMYRAAEAKSNRAALSGRIQADPDAAGSSRAFRSIFPAMSEYKAYSSGNDAAGGILVQAEAGPFFDRLRPDSVILQAGPRVELTESDSLDIPFLNASTTAYRVGENADITDTSATFAKPRIPVRKYAAYSIGSTEWFMDAAHGPRQIVEMDHRAQLAAKLDLDMLQGAAGGIVGLRNKGTDTALAAAGATPTLSNILDAIYRMEANNAKPGALFMHPRTWNTIRKIQDLQNRYQLAPDPSQTAEKRLFNIPVFLSSQISITETSSNSANTDCSYIVLADMRYVVVVRRQEVTVLYDPFTYSKTDRIAVRTTARFGMDVIFAAAIEVLSGVRP